jgi:two-component system NarL family sensor kinase
MQTEYPEIYLQFLATILITFLLIGTIVTILLLYKKKKILQQKKMEAMQAAFEKDLLQTRLEIQEDVLKNISMEIHDNIGQIMLLINVNATILQSMPMTPEAAEVIVETKQLMSKAIDDITQLSRSLHSDRITDLGVCKAIQLELEQMEAKGLFTVSISDTTGDQMPALQNEIQLVIFRVFQEISKNIIKHAKATHVSMLISGQKDSINLTISDNGIGFSVDNPGSSGMAFGVGMRSLKDRIKRINGRIDIRSELGKGTSVSIFVPITHTTIA